MKLEYPFPAAHASSAATSIAAGFRDPVLESQAAFRTLLHAMSEPGTIHTLTGTLGRPHGLGPAMAALALALLDLDTPAWIGPGTDPSAARFITFHTGAPQTLDPSAAAFAIVGDPRSLPRLSTFSQGTLEFPDRSTTILVEVAGLQAGAGWALEGPGIPGRRHLAAEPLPDRLLDDLLMNRQRFPRGVDLVLICGEQIAGLPRSTRVYPATTFGEL